MATVPATRPLRGQDRMIVAGLLAALGRAPAYPAGSSLPGIPVLLERHGLRVVADDRRRFGYRLRGPGDADPFLDSLYLPGLSTRHYRLARPYLRLLGGCHLEMPVPLRRIIAEYPDRGPDRS